MPLRILREFTDGARKTETAECFENVGLIAEKDDPGKYTAVSG